ncbi:UPF0225 protein YchJ [hydrothermal vent metagenome]|uniref:UPF0225 protein YchJ n=1 Tax=hydrothermal vent metagenome TaxID=652676 RepID=A0A3B0XEK2_9ZZZZ
MINKRKLECACGTGKSAETCCLRVIGGQLKAATPAQLMRSRYVAYVQANADYLLQSWHVSTRPETITLEKGLLWTGLTLLSESKVIAGSAGKTGYVEFIARFTHDGVAGQMHERSRFLFEQGRWFYVDGEHGEKVISR